MATGDHLGITVLDSELRLTSARGAGESISRMNAVELVLAHRMGGVLDLLARGSIRHEKGPRRLVPRASYQGGGRRLGGSVAPLGEPSETAASIRTHGALASGSSSSRSGSGSRPGPACTSGATGALPCRRRTNQSW